MIEWLDAFWKGLHPIVQGIILGILAAIIFSALGLVIRLAIKRLQVISQRGKKLKTHFELDINPETKTILRSLNSLTEFCGALLVDSPPSTHSIIYNYSIIYDKPKTLPQPTADFTAHFPKEAGDIAKLKEGVSEHNKRLMALNKQIVEFFNDKNLLVIDVHVIDVNDPRLNPFLIYVNVFRPLYVWWKNIHLGTPNPWPNFNHIYVKSNEEAYNLYVEGWDSEAIAYGETQDDKKYCINWIQAIALNEDFKEKASLQIDSANTLTSKARSIAEQLKSKIYHVENAWPGTKSYKFKKEETCPRCKEIF